MTPHDTRGQRPQQCARARSCSGWFVAWLGFVRCCEDCQSLPDEEAALAAARAAGLDVLGNGLVASLAGTGASPKPRSEGHRATVSANDMLLGILEQLQDVLRLEQLPPALRSSVDFLAIEVAKVQGVSEWVAEDIVRLVEDPHDVGDPEEDGPSG